MNRTHRTFLIFLCVLALIVAVPVVLTWREVRRERLNQALIVAVRRNDTVAVRTLLHQGADPNAPVLPEDTRSFWLRLLDILQHKPVQRASIHTSTLFEAVNYLGRCCMNAPKRAV